MFTHYVRYLGSNVMIVAAGLVSFPIMTRLLDNYQFGILGYYEAWMLLLVGLLKLGAQHAILRFYPHDASPRQIRRFRTDYLLLPLALSMLLWLACVVALAVLGHRFPPAEQPVLWILLFTVPLLIWTSFVEAVMYAQERSDLSLILWTVWRWGEVAMVVVTLFLIHRSAMGVVAARLVMAALVTAWLAIWFLRWCRGPVMPPRRRRVLSGLAFGIPMMFNELTMVMFAFADRILIRALTDSFDLVGIYTIGTSLAMAASALMGHTLNKAFTPTAIRLFETRGAAAVVGLKREMLDVWVVPVAIATALFLCVGVEFLVAMAGADKVASGPIFAVVSIAMVWYSVASVGQYGLLLYKRVTRFFLITLSAVVVNLVLNVPLILAFGIMGAVMATVFSFAFLAVLQLWQCPPELRYMPATVRLLAGAAFPVVMLGILTMVDYFGLESTWPRLMAGSGVILAAGAAMAAADPRFRDGAGRVLARYREAQGSR